MKIIKEYVVKKLDYVQ